MLPEVLCVSQPFTPITASFDFILGNRRSLLHALIILSTVNSSPKAMRSIFIMIVSTVCSIIGGVIGDFFWGFSGSLVLSTVTGIYGLWLGYKLHRDYLDG